MELDFSKKFKRSLKKILSQYPKLENKILDMIDDFEEKLYDSKYFRKNFQYKRKIITELEFGGDWRLLCEVVVIEDIIYLLNIGNHSSLELSSKKKLKI